jgi:hypothetical protein
MRREVASLSIVLVVLASTFAWSVVRRQPWFGALSAGPSQHQNVTAHALKYSRLWYLEGPAAMRFGMAENPASIEFSTWESRRPFFSYPPGPIVPIHALAKVSGTEPSLGLIMGLNLALQFLIAAALSAAIWLLFKPLGLGPCTLLALIPAATEFVLPGPLYWHQNVYWADNLVAFLFAALILLEIVRTPQRRWVDVTQAAVLFAGMMTDWLTPFIAAVLFARRWVDGERRRSWFVAAPVAAGLALYLLLLIGMEISWEQFRDKALFRTGLGAGGEGYVQSFYTDFWAGHVAAGYGRGAVVLLWSALILVVGAALHRKRKDLLPLIWISTLALAPCFLHLYVFRNHCAVHSYTALKFSIPMALVPFVLGPILLVRMFGSEPRWFPVAAALLLAAGTYAAMEVPNYHRFFIGPAASTGELGSAVRAHSKFEEVLFSPDFEIPSYPSWELAYSMKRVYKVATPSDVSVPPGAKPVMVFRKSPDDRWKRDDYDWETVALPDGTSLWFGRRK